jgi:tetratricopeptide (TPR) repeat protein
MSQSHEQMVAATAADDLCDTAERLSVTEGATPRTMAAVGAALRAARGRLAATGGTADRRRLSRALRHQAAVLAGTGQPRKAAEAAREAVGLSRQALLDTPGSGTAFDSVCGELVQRINDLGQILLSLGQDDEARQMLEQAAAVAGRSGGPATAQAALQTQELRLTAALGEAQSTGPGRKPSADTLVEDAKRLVAGRREHASEEDPTTIFDLGQALRLLGEASILCGQARPAAAALDQAYAIFARFDGQAAQDLARHTGDLLERLREVVSARTGNAGSADTPADGRSDTGGHGQAVSGDGRHGEPSATYGLPPWPADDLSETVAEPYARFDEGMQLLLRGDAAAVGPLNRAADMFALLTTDQEPTQQNLALQRRLTLSFWRLMQAYLLAGQAAEGLRSGQMSVTVGVGLLRALPSGHPDRADVLAEILTVIAELSEVTLRSAGQAHDAIGLLRIASGLAGGDPHPGVRQALGRARQVSELIARLAPGEAAAARAAGAWPF